jgi:hypothetical protein
VTPRITTEGSFLLDGHQFRWAFDESETLEVWHWRFGRACTNAKTEKLDIQARRLALDLVDQLESAQP